MVGNSSNSIIGYNVDSSVNMPTTETWANGDIVILSIAIGLIIAFMILMGLYQSLPLYSKFRRVLDYALQSITYFLWGVAGIAFFGIIAWVIKYFSEPGDKIVSLFDILMGILIYLLVCGFGYLIMKFKNRIHEHEIKLKTSQEVRMEQT